MVIRGDNKICSPIILLYIFSPYFAKNCQYQGVIICANVSECVLCLLNWKMYWVSALQDRRL